MGYSKTPIPSTLGQPNFPQGDADERPFHTTTVSPFLMSATEVTNLQYEAFDPSHRALRGKLGFSPNDNDACVFVTHTNASAYAAWLGAGFRLPTEAEWEYAARAGSTAYFGSLGDSVPPSQQKNNKGDTGIPSTPQNLSVAMFAPNEFGLYDTVGNVEEWVSDWWGWYSAEDQTDPSGPRTGTWRVTRGGSHSTSLYYLRTANRAAAHPEDSSWVLGFRVANGKAPSPPHLTTAVPAPPAPPPMPPVARATAPRSHAAAPLPPRVRVYVKIPGDGVTYLPYARHNHDPSVITCEDGSVLAAWFSCYDEPGREVGIAASRLEPGAEEWANATVLLDTPDRCECCPAFYQDEASGQLYIFSSVSAAGTYDDLAVYARASGDCGRTWGEPSIVLAEHGISHQIVVSIVRRSSDGSILMPADHWGQEPFVYKGDQSVIQHGSQGANLSALGTWSTAGNAGNTNAHHFTLAELANGSFIGVGRGHDVNGTLAQSYSLDGGHTWLPPNGQMSAFPGIHGGQRMVMLRAGPRGSSPSAFPLMLCEPPLRTKNPAPKK